MLITALTSVPFKYIEFRGMDRTVISFAEGMRDLVDPLQAFRQMPFKSEFRRRRKVDRGIFDLKWNQISIQPGAIR